MLFRNDLGLTLFSESQCGHEFAGEATMLSFHPANERRARLRRTTDVEERLPRRRALFVITALSVLSWVVLIGLVMALRAVV